jgi:hypothetical protein
MRNRTGSKRNRYSMWLALSVGTLGVALGLTAGCGGGGDGGQPTPKPSPTASPAPRTTKFRATILWRARTRIEAVGLASALSAKFTLYSANIGGGDNVFVRNRDLSRANPTGPYSEEFESDIAALPNANYRFRVQFYSQPGGQGTEVGFADTSATLDSNGNLTGTVATYNIGIQRVVVTPGQTLAFQQNKDIDFKVIDRDGKEVALASAGSSSGITYGGGTVIVKPGYASNLRLESNGSVTALHPALARVCVQVEDKVSDPVDVTITSSTTLSVSPTSVNPLGWQNTLQLTPTLTLPPATLGDSDRAVTYAIEDNDGTKGTISATGLYTAPKADKRVTLVVTSNFDPAKVVRIPVTVTSLTNAAVNVGGTAVTEEPGINKIAIKEVVDFDAVVTNGNLSPVDQAVTWALLDGSKVPVVGNAFGSVTSAGIYRAPTVRPAPNGRCFVRVTPVYDPAKFKDIPIEIVSGDITVDIK